MQGDTPTLAIVALVAVVALLLIWLLLQRRKSGALRDRFGEEYDRPLGPQERERFTGDWLEAKTLFVDSPAEVIGRSDRLLSVIMATRGYPMADFEHRRADLTVDHGEVTRHYLAGHDIADRAGRGEATTEELHQAMNHYERLFDHLVNDTGDGVAARPASAPAERDG